MKRQTLKKNNAKDSDTTHTSVAEGIEIIEERVIDSGNFSDESNREEDSAVSKENTTASKLRSRSSGKSDKSDTSGESRDEGMSALTRKVFLIIDGSRMKGGARVCGGVRRRASAVRIEVQELVEEMLLQKGKK